MIRLERVTVHVLLLLLAKAVSMPLVSRHAQLANDTGNCLSRMKAFPTDYNRCKNELCFLFETGSLFLHVPDSMRKENDQRLIACNKRHKTFPHLTGVALDLLDKTNSSNTLCAYPGPECSPNQLVNFIAEKANSGYQFGILGIMLQTPTRLSQVRIGTSIYESRIIVIGLDDEQLVHLSAWEQLLRPFRPETWALVGLMILMFVILGISIAYKLKGNRSIGDSLFSNIFGQNARNVNNSILLFKCKVSRALKVLKQRKLVNNTGERRTNAGEIRPERKTPSRHVPLALAPENQFSSVFANIGQADSFDVEDSSGSFRIDCPEDDKVHTHTGSEIQGLSKLQISLITWSYRTALISFIAITILFYEAGVVNYLFQQSSAKLKKNLSSLGKDQLSRFCVRRKSALEDVWHRTVDKTGRYSHDNVPWATGTYIQDCMKKMLDPDNRVKYVVTYDGEARMLVNKDSAERKVRVFETKRKLYGFNGGFLYNRKVLEDKQREIDVALLELRMSDEIRRLVDEKAGEPISSQGEAKTDIAWAILAIPFAFIVFPLVFASLICLLK